jgi:hypothetical protein
MSRISTEIVPATALRVGDIVFVNDYPADITQIRQCDDGCCCLVEFGGEARIARLSATFRAVRVPAASALASGLPVVPQGQHLDRRQTP